METASEKLGVNSDLGVSLDLLKIPLSGPSQRLTELAMIASNHVD